MANIIEGIDTYINPGASASNGGMSVGDTFSGSLAGAADPSDGINLGGMTPGETYTVSVTFDSLDGSVWLRMINHADFHSVPWYFTDGVLVSQDSWSRDFIEAGNVTVVGNTITFDFTPNHATSFALEIVDDSGTNNYTVDFEVKGPDANIITGDLSDNHLNGTELNDLADLSDGDDHLNGKGGNDTIYGGDGDDKLKGAAGQDELIGGAGKDQLNGGADNDVLTGGAGNDVLRGGEGNDTIDGGNNNDRISGGSGDDGILGGHGNDKMWGGDGADTIDGGNGNDRMNGGADNDVLIGGAGRDNMTGGTGADTFVFAAGMGKDVIQDFEDGVDTLDFSAYGFTDISDLTIVTQGADVLVSASDSDTVLLENVDIIDLDNSDFIWA